MLRREPSAAALRHRAAELRHFAAAIERAAVFRLDSPAEPAGPSRLALCARMLATNLHQLLTAADELREAAWQLDVRAHHFDGRPRGPHDATAA